MYHREKTRHRKKRKFHQGGRPVETQVGEESKKWVRSRGGSGKLKMVAADYANVVVEGEPVKCEIVDFVENPVNQDYDRRNIITRGAVLKVKTPDGDELNAKVTSRPGQTGVINAVSL